MSSAANFHRRQAIVSQDYAEPETRPRCQTCKFLMSKKPFAPLICNVGKFEIEDWGICDLYKPIVSGC